MPGIELSLGLSAVESPQDPREEAGANPQSHFPDGETEARWLAELSWKRSAQALGPSRHTSVSCTPEACMGQMVIPPGTPWTVLGNSEPVPSGREEKSVASSHLSLTKARFSGARRPQACPQWPEFALASVPGRAMAMSCSSTQSLQPPRVEGSTRAPRCHRPSAALVGVVVPTTSRAWITSSGFLIAAPRLFPVLTDRLLPSWFLPGQLEHNLGLFMASSTVTFP